MKAGIYGGQPRPPCWGVARTLAVEKSAGTHAQACAQACTWTRCCWPFVRLSIVMHPPRWSFSGGGSVKDLCRQQQAVVMSTWSQAVGSWESAAVAHLVTVTGVADTS